MKPPKTTDYRVSAQLMQQLLSRLQKMPYNKVYDLIPALMRAEPIQEDRADDGEYST